MPLYFFNLKDGRGVIPDPDGTELGDDASARAHATEVARELLHRREKTCRAWRLQVCDAERRPLFEVLLAEADESLDHLSPELRTRLNTVYVKTGGLNDAIEDVRM